MTRGRNDFDRLQSWAAMPDPELEKVIDADAIAALRRVVWLLGGAREASLPLDRAAFVAIVREMDRLYREGARSFGEAMAEAQEWGEKRDAVRARAAYERLLERCGSKFHRDLARFQLRKLGANVG